MKLHLTKLHPEKVIDVMKQFMILCMLIGIPVLMGCAGAQSGAPAADPDTILITPRQLKDIAGIKWHLKRMKLDGETISLIKDTNITFSCDGNGNVAGAASLNRYFGSFALKEDGGIVWGKAFGMTRMAGPPELMDQEDKFMQALPLTARFYLQKEMLVLTSTDQAAALEFEKN